MKAKLLLQLVLLAGLAAGQDAVIAQSDFPRPESWNIEEAEALARDEALSVPVMTRLLQEACSLREQDFALALLAAFLEARGGSLGTSRALELYGGLTWCMYGPGDVSGVARTLEDAHARLAPLAIAHNDHINVYRMAQSLARYRVARGAVGPCAPLVPEIEYRKRIGLDAIESERLASLAAEENWALHFFLVKSITLDQSEEAVSHTRRLFLEGYYDERLPDWRRNPSLLDIIVNMTCVLNPAYLDTLVRFFFNDSPASAASQINSVMDYFYPPEPGYERRVTMSESEDNRFIEVDVGYYTQFGDGHGTSVTFMAVEFRGETWWLPVANGSRWVA